VGTHGRGFWILDDITPLRQIDARVAASKAVLFKPQAAYRVRGNMNTDTPLPPDEPAGKNPPDGAILNYYLKSDVSDPIALEILDSNDKVVRRYSSADKPEPVVEKDLDVPTYWIRPFEPLSASAGMHRFVWDLRYAPPQGVPRSYPIAAIYRDTPSEPRGPLVLPGEYRVRLTVNGKTYSEPLTVKMDPRVKTPPEGLRQQFTTALGAWEAMHRANAALAEIKKVRSQLRSRPEKPDKGLVAAMDALDKKVAELQGARRPRRADMVASGIQSGADRQSLTSLVGEFAAILQLVEGADVAPTTQAVAAAEQSEHALSELLATWSRLKSQDLGALNQQLRQANLPPLAP
jgi:hypothetical protein